MALGQEISFEMKTVKGLWSNTSKQICLFVGLLFLRQTYGFQLSMFKNLLGGGQSPTTALPRATTTPYPSSIPDSARCIINHPMNANRAATLRLAAPLSVENATLILSNLTSELNITVLDEFIQLYEITDGVVIPDEGAFLQDLWVIPGYYLMSLSDAVETYQNMSTIIDDNVWNTTWLPFMASGSGDFYVIDMLSGRVQEVMLTEDPDDEVSFSNLTAFLQNVCQNFTNGIYYMDEDGQLSEKDGKPNTNPVDEITQEINDVRGNYLGNVLAGLSKLGVGRKRRQTLGEQGSAMSVIGTLSSLSLAAYKIIGIPFLPFVCNSMPAVCANMENAVKNDDKPRFLCRITDRNQIKRNRRKACGKFRTKIGMSCDEYPFASTMQGGKGATVASVPKIENSIQGAQLGAFYKLWKIGGIPPKSCYVMVNP